MGVLFFKGCGGGNVKSGSLQGSPCLQGEPNPFAVPLAKRGEPAGGGYINLTPPLTPLPTLPSP